MPKISIVMPVYNSEKYLESCLESIAAQTFKDFELICVNDGSTDNSLKILEDTAKNTALPMKIITVENQGAGAARNKGFEYVTGETTIFLDSDDYFYPDFLEEMYKKYEKTDADIVICKYDVVLPDGSFYAKNQGASVANLPLGTAFRLVDRTLENPGTQKGDRKFRRGSALSPHFQRKLHERRATIRPGLLSREKSGCLLRR